MSKYYKNDGFTIIEVITVIVIIGILSTIGIFSFNGVQANQRDSQRLSQATIITESIEKYFDASGEYPSCEDLKSSTAADILKIDPAVLVTPKDTNSVNSIKCDNDTSDFFDLIVHPNGSWTLKFQKESTNGFVEINSRRTTIDNKTLNIIPRDPSTFYLPN